MTVSLDDGVVCRESLHGGMPGASGTAFEFDRRYGFIDRRLYVYDEEDDDRPDMVAPAEARWQQPLARCQALVSAARTGAAQ